jgi:regulator of replication initiation timing
MSERIYNSKTVNFILVAKTVAGHFKENINELGAVNTGWTPEYAAILESRIDTVAGDYLGINNRNKLFQVTIELNAALKTVRSELVTLKKNLDADFRSTPEYTGIMSEFGLNGVRINHLSQPDLIATLSNIKRKLTPEMMAKITSKGMPASLPNRISSMADTIMKINNEQEVLKGSIREATGQMVEKLNSLYVEIIKICKLAADFYKKDPVKKSMFTFSSVMKSLGDTSARTVTKKAVA